MLNRALLDTLSLNYKPNLSQAYFQSAFMALKRPSSSSVTTDPARADVISQLAIIREIAKTARELASKQT
jgi:hypothetical protein